MAGGLRPCSVTVEAVALATRLLRALWTAEQTARLTPPDRGCPERPRLCGVFRCRQSMCALRGSPWIPMSHLCNVGLTPWLSDNKIVRSLTGCAADAV
jgi:hypothetical protein